MVKDIGEYITYFRCTDKDSFKLDKRTIESLFKEARKAKKKPLLVVIFQESDSNWHIECRISKQKGKQQ